MKKFILNTLLYVISSLLLFPGCREERQFKDTVLKNNSITEKVILMIVDKKTDEILKHLSPTGVFVNEEGNYIIKSINAFESNDLSKYIFDTAYIHKKKRLFYTDDVRSFRDIFLNKKLKIQDRYDVETNYIKINNKYYNYSSFIIEDISYKYTVFIYNNKDDFYIFGFSIDRN